MNYVRVRRILQEAAIGFALFIGLSATSAAVAGNHRTEVMATNGKWSVLKVHGQHGDYCVVVSKVTAGHGMSLDLWGQPVQTTFVAQDPRFTAKTGTATIFLDGWAWKDVKFDASAPTMLLMYLPNSAMYQMVNAGSVQVQIANGPKVEYDMTGASEMMFRYQDCLRSVAGQ